MTALTRRSFLLGGAGLAVLAACGGSSKGGVKVAKPDDSSSATTGPTKLNLLVTSSLLLPAVDQRVGFVMAGNDGGFIKPDAPVSVAFAPSAPGGAPGTFGATMPASVHLDAGGAPAYSTIVNKFAGAGTFWARVVYKGAHADAAFAVGSAESAAVPAPGQPMVKVPTPIVSDHRGVEPICTRDPACPWHDTSLDTALGAGLPVAVLFATPRLCQTATCGPVLDTLLSLRSKYEPKVRFVHVEIYTDGSGKATAPKLAPAVEAYHLPSEPVLFLAGADGVVRERIDGLYGAGEADAALGRLVA